MKLTIEQKLRASGVTRWHMVRLANRQSLSDHLVDVAMITMELCIHANMDWKNPVLGALVHDLHEVMYGDIPTPTKDRMREKGIEFNDLFPKENFGIELSTKEKLVIRIADKIADLYWLYCNLSSAHSVAVYSDLRSREHEFLGSLDFDDVTRAVAIVGHALFSKDSKVVI